LKDRKGKEDAQMRGAAKFFIDTGKMRGQLDVFHINGEKPVIHRNMRLYGYYLLPGKNTVQVQYRWQPLVQSSLKKISGLSYEMGLSEKHLEPKELALFARPNSEYILYYDRKKDDYKFEEKGV
jgi:hypothetical protein